MCVCVCEMSDLDLSPTHAIVANEGLGWDPPVKKMFQDPGGDDCIPGR